MNYLRMETPRLILRQWQPSDYEPLVQMGLDPEVMRYFPKTHTAEESRAFIDKSILALETNRFGFWAVEEKSSGEFLGFVALANINFEASFTPAIEIGWRFKTSAWGKGFASEGATALLRYGFETLNLNEILALTAKINQSSWRVMERIGMICSNEEEFDHPRLPEGHILRRHVCYRMNKARWFSLAN